VAQYHVYPTNVGEHARLGKGFWQMQRWYLICEKKPEGNAKFLSVVRDGKVGRNALRRFAERSPHEVYLMDVLTRKVVLRILSSKGAG
jgi:hypothetical protein